MSNKIRIRRREPGRAELDRVREDLTCPDCQATPRLSFSPRKGLAAAVPHAPECRAVPAGQRAAGRTVYRVSPVVIDYEIGG